MGKDPQLKFAEAILEPVLDRMIQILESRRPQCASKINDGSRSPLAIYASERHLYPDHWIEGEEFILIQDQSLD